MPPHNVAIIRKRIESKEGKAYVKRILILTSGPGDWARLLAQPVKHWKPGKSAMSLAASWETAHPRMPAEVVRTLEVSSAPELQSLVLLAAIPEYEVGLPGGETASHTDLLVLAGNERGLAVIAVEGKVDEEFGPTLLSKRAEASDGQEERLAYLHDALQVSKPLDGAIRYQLLHRTASAVIVAREFHASVAVMLVHSFSPIRRWFDDYVAFGKALGVGVVEGRALRAPHLNKPPLYLGWACGDQRFREVVVPASA